MQEAAGLSGTMGFRVIAEPGGNVNLGYGREEAAGLTGTEGCTVPEEPDGSGPKGFIVKQAAGLTMTMGSRGKVEPGGKRPVGFRATMAAGLHHSIQPDAMVRWGPIVRRHPAWAFSFATLPKDFSECVLTKGVFGA